MTRHPDVKKKQDNQAWVICIAGPSGCGKSALAHALYEHYGSHNVALISCDRYYKDHSGLSLAERAEMNFDTPDAIDQALLVEHVKDLQSGQDVASPRYNFTAHVRSETTDHVKPKPIILVEGTMALTVPEIRSISDLTIFIDTPLDICLLRRLSRDCLERGRDVESVLRQYLRTVRPMFYEHILPCKAHATHVFPDGGPCAYEQGYQTINACVGIH